MKDIELIQILWDYMKMNHKVKKADCIIGLGTSDCRVAEVSADLYLKGYSNKIIFTGGYGKVTYRLWNEPEADKFERIAIQKGVLKKDIYKEKESTNTGDNFRFTKELIKKENLDVKSFIIVCKPYSEKRVYATFKKLMPEYEAIVISQDISCAEYYNETESKEWMQVLVGDIQRMSLFAKKGWQIKMDIPDEVLKAYKELIHRGYDKYIIKIGVEDNKNILLDRLRNIYDLYIDKENIDEKEIENNIIEFSEKFDIITKDEMNLSSAYKSAKDRWNDLIKETDYKIEDIFKVMYYWKKESFK